jgi:hypothetical protein
LAQRPSTPDKVQALLVTACQLLSHSERVLLRELLAEQQNSNTLGRLPASAATDLAGAATTLVAITAFATALNTAGWEVAD